MQTAKDIMSAPALSVTENQSVKEVLKLLAEKRISGFPVVNDEGKITGIISDTDILRYAHTINVIPLSNLSGWVSPYADINDLADMRKGFNMLHSTLVRQIMTKKVYLAKADDPANEVAKLMNKHKINRVPVADDQGKLMGIITRSDMVMCLANLQT